MNSFILSNIICNSNLFTELILKNTFVPFSSIGPAIAKHEVTGFEEVIARI